MLRVEEVVTTAALDALRPEWEALWERCPTTTPFQSPEWLLAWWRHFGSDAAWTLAVRRGGRLVALAPLFVYTDHEHGERRLRFIGAGISDYLDVLLEPDNAAAAADALLEHIADRSGCWDDAAFDDLPARSPWLARMASAAGESPGDPQSACPVLQLPRTPDAYLARLSQGRRRKLRLARRRLEASGGLRIERADALTLPSFLDALFELHGARWAERHAGGVLGDPTVQSFHRDAAAGLLRRGALRMHRLWHDGAVAAVLYGFAWRDRWYSYLGGFDPALEAFSPGTVIIAHAIEEAIGDGQRTFDFLRGQEAYKYAWGASDEFTYRGLLQAREVT